MSIPALWTKSYSSIFSSSLSREVSVKAASPTALTSVILTALSNDAYTHACGDSSALEDSLCNAGTIVRQGDVLNIYSEESTTSENGSALKYRLEMAEPVLQGFAKRGETKIILLSMLDDPSVHEDSETEGVSEQEDFEIDEDFLGSSVLITSASSPLPAHQDAPSNGINHFYDHYPLRFTSKALSDPPGLPEDDCTLYLRTSDLGKLGILSGDWVCDLVLNCQYNLNKRRKNLGNRKHKTVKSATCAHSGK